MNFIDYRRTLIFTLLAMILILVVSFVQIEALGIEGQYNWVLNSFWCDNSKSEENVCAHEMVHAYQDIYGLRENYNEKIREHDAEVYAELGRDGRHNMLAEYDFDILDEWSSGLDGFCYGFVFDRVYYYCTG